MGRLGARCVLLLVAGLVAGGCGKGEESTPAATSAKPVTSATAVTKPTATATATAAPAEDPAAAKAEAEKAGAELRRHHRHHHHGGVAMFIHMAIDTLGVPAEKKAQLEKIQAELHAKMAPARDAEREVLTLLADGVAAGKIDSAKVDAALAKQAKASAALHEASLESLDQLHAALSPAERGALVEKVKANIEVWKKTNHDEEVGSKEKGTRLARLAEDLALTPEQVDKISAALKKDAPPKADVAPLETYLKDFETAFVADKFDAKTLSSANAANTLISKHGGARMVRFYKIVTPLLTPEQRTKLAEHLRERLKDPHVAK